MPSHAERLHRLEAGGRAAEVARSALARDQADLERRIDAIRACGRLPDGSPVDVDQETAWTIGRGMLASLPGCAELFAQTTMVDYLC